MDMDPQTAAFMPRDELWRINSEMSRLHQIQHEHAERLSRVERRQDEDISRTKSLWGSQSPFPGILAGTPQQRPMEQPPTDAFSGFDDPANMIGSLHLDAEDEPRRVGATSRANSVRFDESANQGHWAHPSRVSLDLLHRSASSLGSHPLIERTYSHKSDGRQSSAGHSVHSATSRANSLGIDTLNAIAGEGPATNPGLFVLGTCPAIVRCWLTTKFKNDSLLYAAVCTGSHESSLTRELVRKLGFSDRIERDEAGFERVKISLYLPEATVRTASVRSSSPESQLPSITVKFTVNSHEAEADDKTIRVFIGSDVLRTHNADLLFSSNTLSIYDDDGAKLSVPLVRPENESTFRSLRVTSTSTSNKILSTVDASKDTNGTQAIHPTSEEETKSPETSKPQLASPTHSYAASAGTKEERGHFGDSSRPQFPVISTTREAAIQPDLSSPPSKNGSSPAIWTSWRREPEKSASSPTSDSNWGKAPVTYQRREQGIKVLRPLKSTSTPRSLSITQSTSSPLGTQAQSRFFEDGKRRVSGEGFDNGTVKRHGSGVNANAGSVKEGSIGRPAGTNPVGGASAFSWLSK